MIDKRLPSNFSCAALRQDIVEDWQIVICLLANCHMNKIGKLSGKIGTISNLLFPF